jgi:hypothetical protein
LGNLSIVVDGETIVERWVDIPNYEGLYMVSSFGRVMAKERVINRSGIVGIKRSGTQKRKAKILNQIVSNTKRLMTTLCKENNPKMFQVSRLVAMSFLENPQNKPEVNHKDGKFQENFVWNLEWNTKRENSDHAVKNGLKIRGERMYSNVLSEKQVLEIFNSNLTQKELSKIYNVHFTTCGYIKSGKLWGWLTGKKYKKGLKKSKTNG